MVLDSTTTNPSIYLPFELGKQYDTTPQEHKRVHYPHLLAPPALRTSNLPSYRPARFLNPVLWTSATLGNKEKEQQLREYMWKTELPCNPSRTFTPDAVTDYEYDYDNRLVEVSLPTNSDTVEYTYDAMGRRLTKKFTYHNGTNTDVTTYKYHYIGGQITEIEIDAIRNPGEGQTVLRNEEVKIHLGANSQPISYEWVKHVGESTTSATYYYHYDIHGNVLKITDSSENVKITYTYDVLGKILTETNPDSVLNFFTFRGASQTIWDSEVGMYYSGGYYRPDTGTALQGTGAPVLTNPASGAMLNSMAQVNKINRQMAIQARRAVKTAGVTGGGRPGGFAPPPGTSDGMSRAGRQRPSRDPNPAPPKPLDLELVGTGNVLPSVYDGNFEGVNIDPNSGKYKDEIQPGPGWRDKLGGVTDDGGGGAKAVEISKGLDPGSENTGGSGDGEISDCQWPPRGMRGENGLPIIGGSTDSGVEVNLRGAEFKQNGVTVGTIDRNGNFHLKKLDSNGNFTTEDATDPKDIEASWKKIVDGVKAGNISAQAWDASGRQTDAMFSMKMSDGTWSSVTISNFGGSYICRGHHGLKDTDVGADRFSSIKFKTGDTVSSFREIGEDGGRNDNKTKFTYLANALKMDTKTGKMRSINLKEYSEYGKPKNYFRLVIGDTEIFTFWLVP